MYAPETCDDGDKNDGVGCLSDCSGNMTGWYCIGGNQITPSTCSVKCGDLVIISPNENCDDGNVLASDGCSSVCKVEAGWTCVGSPP